MLEHQNEHFVRDFLQFSHFASESTFSYEFSCEPQNLLPQNRCFVRGFRQLSAHLTKCHAVRLPHKTTFHTLRNTSECHEVPRLPRGTKHRDMWNLQKWPLFAELTIGTAIRPSRDGCGRLRHVERTHRQPPRPPEWNGNPCYAFGKNVRNIAKNHSI